MSNKDVKRLVKEKDELAEALAQACSKLNHALTLVENKSVGKDILKYDKRLSRILNTEKLEEVLKRHKTNQIMIRKINNSTLTRIDIRYDVRVCLITDSEEFYFTATSSYCTDYGEALRVAEKTSRVLEFHGIEHEILNKTGE